jgi:hypothetical protein
MELSLSQLNQEEKLKSKIVTIHIPVFRKRQELPMLNATEYALLLNESYANGGNAIPFLMFLV